MTDIPGLNELIRIALSEDIGSGDLTTNATVVEDSESRGRFIAKEALVVCGLPAAAKVFEAVDPRIRFSARMEEGAQAEKGSVIAIVEGPSRGILTGERTALNLMQRMSGIATRTREAVRQVEGTRAVITDTRKTTPGLRGPEKYAVRVGGGRNHRFGLFDGILIKENHIRAAGGIAPAVERARAAVHHLLKIEVEVEDFIQLQEALDAGADVIMLDNMSIPDMARAVETVKGRALVEASGNMGEKGLVEVAKTGVDLISVGALTHSVRAADISLRFDHDKK